MKQTSATVAVFATFAACVSFLFAAGDGNSDDANSERRESTGLPTGTGTPEGAACDFVCSLIDRNEKLFRERRLVVSCETPSDVHRSWLELVDSRLGPGPQSRQGCSEATFDPVRVLRVHPARPLDLSDEQKAMHWAGLMFNYGVCESVLVDVETEDLVGQRFMTTVESLRLTAWSPKLQRSVPDDLWRARVQRTVTERDSSQVNSSLRWEAVE